MKPIEVTDVDMAFPAQVAHLMPPEGEIPREFWEWHGNEWVRITEHWFAKGLKGDAEVQVKEGIDAVKAFRHLHCIMGTYSCKHEYKIAAVAYLMSEWFVSFTGWQK